MRIALCDDDVRIRKQVADLCRQVPGINAVEEFDNGVALINHYRQEAPPFNILILDILMPDLNGLDVAGMIRKIDDAATIIFLTTSEKYALKGYDVHAFHYLLKPIEEKQMLRVIRQAVRQQHFKMQRVLLRFGKDIKPVDIAEILFIAKESRNALVHFADGTTFKSSQPIRELAELLPQDIFVLTDQSFLVNLYHVTNFVQSVRVLEIGHRRIPVARSRIAEVKSLLMKHASGESQ